MCEMNIFWKKNGAKNRVWQLAFLISDIRPFCRFVIGQSFEVLKCHTHAPLLGRT